MLESRTVRAMSPFTGLVLLLCTAWVSPVLSDDFDPPTDVTCAATDGNNYPVTIEWINNDPLGIYTEIYVYQGDELIATLTDPTSDSYTDGSGPAGPHLYTVHVYSEDEDCTVESEESCLIEIGKLDVCATDGDFVEIELELDLPEETTLEFYNDDLAAVDGTSTDDLSPTEDDRIDITGVQVKLVFSTDSVDSFAWSLSSPEGTEVSLWDGDGGAVEWTEGGVTLADLSDPIPDPIDSDCSVSDCRYAPPGSLADFYAEDAQGDWQLEGVSSDGGTLHDWCLELFVDEFSEWEKEYIRGDVNYDFVVQPLVDALQLLVHFFGDAPEPPCWEAADVDGNGLVSAIIDALRLLQYWFGDANEPPTPFPSCGYPYGYEWYGVEEPCREAERCP